MLNWNVKPICWNPPHLVLHKRSHYPTTDPGYWFYNYLLPLTLQCIGSFVQHVMPFALVPILATRCCSMTKLLWPPGYVTCNATLPWITLSASSVSIESVYSSARVTSVKSAKPLGVRETWTHRSDQEYLDPIKMIKVEIDEKDNLWPVLLLFDFW